MSDFTKGQGGKIAIKFTQPLIGDVSGLTPTPVGYKMGTTDLAQGKTVMVGDASYGAGSNAVDGNVSTYWGTYSTMPWWITIDLGSIQKTAGFYVLQSNSSYRGRAYTLYGSNDNSTWNSIISGELVNATEQTIEYSAKDYRYIKLSITSYWSGSIMFIYTLKIFQAVSAGNEMAFTVSGKQYQYVKGVLIDKQYKVISVESHPTEANSVLLTFDTYSRFCTVNGDITVNYDSSKGNLSGQGGAVASFIQTFTPTELLPEPNPGIQENISVAPSITMLFTPISYSYAYDLTENITVNPATVIIDFTDISIVNP